MNNFGNFLWKIFSATMVFFFHMGTDYATAADTTGTCETPETPQYYAPNYDKSTDKKISTDYFIAKNNSSNLPTTGSRVTKKLSVCPSGQYLARCGMATLGTNWLKGMTKKGNIETPDFYSYNIGTSESVHMENLRKFFAGKDSFKYNARTRSTDSSSGTYVYTPKTATPDDYKPALNQILSNYCTDEQGRLANTVCETCPNNATIARSTVEEDTYCTGKILWDTWNVHTIADCYMNEFEDSTGSYVYVPNNITPPKNAADAKLTCYYSQTVTGSSLYYK